MRSSFIKTLKYINIYPSLKQTFTDDVHKQQFAI